MAINQRRKGKAGEKKAINFFEAWTGMSFKKSPASGGLRGHVAEYTVGDIICVEKNYIFPYSVEVKNYADINFAHLLYDSKSDIIKYWEQCVDDSKRAEKFPILLMRYNGLPANFFFVAMSYEDYKLLKNNNIKIPARKMFIKDKEHHLVITSTDEMATLSWKKVEKVLMKNLRRRWQ